MEINDRLRTTVEHVYDLLVRGQYDAIAAFTRGIRLSADDIERAVQNYRYALRHWPVSQELPIDAIEITGSQPRAWSIQVDAYTTEEGRSDLTMELTVAETESGEYRVEFDDLHVL